MKNWAGCPLDSFDTILNYLRKTRTETGLKVTASLSRRVYETGEIVTPKQMASLNLQLSEILPDWNYSLFPRKATA